MITVLPGAGPVTGTIGGLPAVGFMGLRGGAAVIAVMASAGVQP